MKDQVKINTEMSYKYIEEKRLLAETVAAREKTIEAGDAINKQLLDKVAD